MQKTGFLTSRLICSLLFLLETKSLSKINWFIVFQLCWTKAEYRKGPKFWDATNLCCYLPKIQTKKPNLTAFCQNDANGLANSEDPDQTALNCSSRSSLIWICTVCSDLPVPKLRVITVFVAVHLLIQFTKAIIELSYFQTGSHLQAMQTKIILLLEEPNDQVLHCLPFHFAISISLVCSLLTKDLSF